jgi:hypothetical protein
VGVVKERDSRALRTSDTPRTRYYERRVGNEGFVGCEMSRRRLAIVLTMALVLVLVGAVACGSSASTTTSSAQPESTTTTAVSATTTVAVSTTSVASSSSSSTESSTSSSGAGTTESTGPSSTTSSIAMTPELEKYKTEMTAWATAVQQTPDSAFLKITDPTAATPADIQKADAFSASVRKVLDQLKAIQPPAQVADAHNKLVKVFGDEITAVDDFIKALRNKDAAAMKTASDKGKQLGSELEQLLGQLSSYLG